jgi:O-antigen/teichoic acid export membrane protein
MFKRLVPSLGLSGIIYSVVTLGQIVSVPILLHAWGDRLYGEWLALTSLVASLNLFNAGVQTHVMNLLIGHHVRGEIEAGRRVLHSALRLYTLLCGLALGVTLVLAFTPSLAGFLNLRALPASHLRLIVLMQGLLATYAILEGLLMSLLIVSKQMPRRLMYSLVERVVFVGAPALVAALGGAPLSVSLILAVGMMGIAFVQLADVRRRSPFPPGLEAGSWRHAFSLLAPSLTFFAVTLSYQLLTTGIVIVISAGVGPAAVALYSTTLMLTNFVRSLLSQGLNVLWPEVTSDSAQGAKNLFFWYRLSLKLMGTFVVAMAILLYTLGPEALAYWTRGRLEPDAALNALLVLYLLVHAPELVARTYGLATNRQSPIFKVELFTALLAILLSLSFIPSLGLRGAAWALALSQFIGSGTMQMLALGWTHGTRSVWFQDVIVRGLPSFAWAALTGLSIAAFVANPWGKGAFAVLSILVYILLAWTLWFSNDEKVLLHKHSRRLMVSLSNRVFSQT